MTRSMAQHDFSDIRPYRDYEVAGVIERLCDSTALAYAIMKVQHPKVNPSLEIPLTRFIQRRINKAMQDVTTIEAFQSLTGGFLENIINTTMTEFTFSTDMDLDPQKPYLFISNHRDITLDSALLNYVLLKLGVVSVEIAIGDNLLKQTLVADLLRLNKSFIVNRSAQGVKEKYRALTKLSHYMYSTRGEGRSMWIAQREGRAKNGIDATDPAILKMLHVWAKKQGMSFAETMRYYNVVPVSIAYEYDPCDAVKVQEQLDKLDSETQVYQKDESEDLSSIMQGISMPKGRVHLHIGESIVDGVEDPETMSGDIDKQIVAGYKLFPSNFIACTLWMATARDISEEVRTRIRALQDEEKRKIGATQWAAAEHAFQARLAEYSAQIREGIVEQYANPVIRSAQLGCASMSLA